MLAEKFLFCLVALAAGVVYADDSGDEDDGRIVNGQTISINSAPYMVQIKIGKSFSCGGSLVAPSYVVTAAHCVDGMDVKKFVIVARATNLSDKGIERVVTKFQVHDGYNKKTMFNDIAALKLNAPVKDVPYLTLCKQPLRDSDSIQVSGWGQLGEKSSVSNTLRTVMLPVRSYENCKKEFGPYVKENTFCASGVKAIGTCKGDSGSPAVYKGQLCGIVAFTHKCGEVGRVSAFTSVYHMRAFVENFIRNT